MQNGPVAEKIEGETLLHGTRVAFTGRLASMTRREAAELVRAHGGKFVPTVTRRTSLLVIGQEGWPLRNDGRLSNKLQKARLLQRKGWSITILSEEGLLERLGLESQSEGVRGRYSMAQLARLLEVPRDRIRIWLRAGLVEPVETVHSVCYFDFQQVSGAKTLSDLAKAGVSPERIRKSLGQLCKWLGNVEQPLAQLAALEQSGQLLVRLEEGQLAESTGQLHFDFASQERPVLAEASRGPSTAEEWFALGCEHDQAERLTEAADCYRQALLIGGPDADVCFNLANVLHALGRKEQAAERYRQAVEIDREFVEAWNNLGNVLAELGQREEAVVAYRGAVELNPLYADAHYNLADLLDQLGRDTEARPHWQAYLRHDGRSEHAHYARARLYAGGRRNTS